MRSGGDGRRGGEKTVFHNALRIKTNKFLYQNVASLSNSLNLVFLPKHTISSRHHRRPLARCSRRCICTESNLFYTSQSKSLFQSLLFHVIYGMEIIVIAHFKRVVNLSSFLRVYLSLALTFLGCLIRR